MRLFIIYYICTPTVTDTEMAKFEQVLGQLGCDLSPLPYLKRWKAITQRSLGGGGGGGQVMAANPYEGSGTKTVSMFSKLVSQGSNFVMEGVKNLVVKRHNLPLTKTTEQLMESRHTPETEEFLYLDPKLLKGGDVAPKQRSPFHDAVVFVVGGGNYIEYQNLVDFIKAKHSSHSSNSSTQRRIIYGSSTLNNAKQFLKQLSLLGQEIQHS